MIRYRVAVCGSVHISIFMGILYVIQGSILAFGSFLAWETKKVRIICGISSYTSIIIVCNDPVLVRLSRLLLATLSF